jgi:hypothetical protein
MGRPQAQQVLQIPTPDTEPRVEQEQILQPQEQQQATKPEKKFSRVGSEGKTPAQQQQGRRQQARALLKWTRRQLTGSPPTPVQQEQQREARRLHFSQASESQDATITNDQPAQPPPPAPWGTGRETKRKGKKRDHTPSPPPGINESTRAMPAKTSHATHQQYHIPNSIPTTHSSVRIAAPPRLSFPRGHQKPENAQEATMLHLVALNYAHRYNRTRDDFIRQAKHHIPVNARTHDSGRSWLMHHRYIFDIVNPQPRDIAANVQHGKPLPANFTTTNPDNERNMIISLNNLHEIHSEAARKDFFKSGPR